MAKKKEAAALLAPTPDINITINNTDQPKPRIYTAGDMETLRRYEDEDAMVEHANASGMAEQRGGMQEGGSLMSPREGYGVGSLATKLAKNVVKKLGKSADEAWDSSAKKQEFVQKAVNSLTDEDKTRIERKEYGLISHYGDKLDVEQFSRPGIERHKETILWNSGGDMKQYEKYLDNYI